MLPQVREDAYTGPRARALRQAIHRRRVRLGWSEFMLRYIMDSLGYGSKLTLLPEDRLSELLELLTAYRPPRPDGWDYDPQARYLCALQHQAGWSDEQLRAFITYHFRKTHLNLLTEQERASLEATLKNVISGEPQ